MFAALAEESTTDEFDNSSSLFCLQHLQKLNLAANNFNRDFSTQKVVTLDISINSYSLGRELKLENSNLQSKGMNGAMLCCRCVICKS